MFVTIAAAVFFAGSASAAVLYAKNNGVDSLTCGAIATPCRSISQAIVSAGASPATTILVGPGIYGDINGDGTLDTTPFSGEENPSNNGGRNLRRRGDRQRRRDVFEAVSVATELRFSACRVLAT